MKRSILLSIGVFVVLSSCILSACDSDLLNTQNPNEQTTQSFWKTKSDAVKGTNAIYGALQLDGSFKRFMSTEEDLRGDDAQADSPAIYFTNTGNFTLSATTLPVQLIWKVSYEGIFRANQVLKNVPDIEMDKNLKNRLLGEAHFLRGLYYFDLVKIYHNVPLVLKVAESQEDYNVPQAPPDSVWAQIEKDFQAAIPVLPLSYSDENIGRATKGTAESYLGKAYLFNEDWQKAANQFKKVIDSGEYGLVDNYRENFTATNENNKESIFEVQFSESAGGTVNGFQAPPTSAWGETQFRSVTYSPTGFGFSDIIPTQGLFNAFQQEKTVNGNPDPRLRASIFYNYPGETVYGTPFKQAYTGADTTNIFWRKFESDTPGGSEIDGKSGINIRLMRYADVLLMYAEAENNLDNTDKAYTYIQKVRDRANLPDLQTVKPGMSQQQMQDKIAHERYLELNGEGHRFDDIVRWGWLEDPQKLNLLKQHDPEFNGYTDGREYLPIPQTELDTNPKLEQNSGYTGS